MDEQYRDPEPPSDDTSAAGESDSEYTRPLPPYQPNQVPFGGQAYETSSQYSQGLRHPPSAAAA